MRKLALALSLASLVGCYTTRVVSSAAAGSLSNENMNLYFVYGLTEADVHANECKNGLAKVEFQLPWYHVFVTGFTGGLVDVGTTKYTCAAAPVGGSGDSAPQAAK